MSSLKLDLKILDKVLLLFIIVIISSCQSITLLSSSDAIELSEIESSEISLYCEFELPVLPSMWAIPIEVSYELIDPQFEKIIESDFLPVLSPSLIKKPSVSRLTTTIMGREYALPILEFLVKSKDVVVKPIVKHVIKPVIKPIVKPIVKVVTPVVNKPTTTKPLVKPIVKPVVKPVVKTLVIESESKEILFLEDMEVLTNKSFTIEMDQTGWLYEGDLKNLKFEEKYYINSKVLFEFISKKADRYSLEFVKYTDSGKVYSKINIDVVDEATRIVGDTDKALVITPEHIQAGISEKSRLEAAMKDIDNSDNPDEIYFKLGSIYYDEGLLKKSKEYYEYVYDNYPLSIYYDEAKEKMDYIIDNFLKRR